MKWSGKYISVSILNYGRRKLEALEVNKMMGISIILLCVFFSIMHFGCEKPPEPLDRKTIRMIDTLAAKEIKLLRKELDSLCEAQFDVYVQTYVDSIMQVRMEEIKALIQ